MKAKRKSKTAKRLVFSILSIAAVTIVAFLLLRPRAIAYERVNSKTGDIKTYYAFSGNVETKNRQTIISDKIMHISDILVKEGDIVKTGDVLIKTAAGDSIISKINGEVAGISVEENAQVMVGTTLLEIVDYNDLEIKVKVDEYDISALTTGKTATVKIGAIDKEIKGTISSLSKEGQVVSGITYFMAAIDLEKDEGLKIGMSAEITLLRNEATGVVTLPMAAISFDYNNNPYVFKQDKNGKTVKIAITTGINDGTTAEVKSGVLSGETILYTRASTSTTNMGFGRSSSVSSNVGGTQ